MTEDPFHNKPIEPGSPGNPRQNTFEQEKISIKIATIEDLEAFKKIRLEAINTDPDAFNLTKEQVLKENNWDDTRWKLDLLDKEQFVVLSEYGSKPVGMARGVKNVEGTWVVRSVFLSPDFRKKVTGSSISEEILQKLLEEVKSRGGVQARLWVLVSRENAIKLYEKLGFKKVGLKRAITITRNPMVLLKFQVMELDLTVKEKK